VITRAGGLGTFTVVARVLHERDVAALLGHQGQRGRHVAADRVAGDGDPGGVEPVRVTVVDDPARRGVALLDRGRVARLGRPVVLREHHRGVRADGEVADRRLGDLAGLYVFHCLSAVDWSQVEPVRRDSRRRGALRCLGFENHLGSPHVSVPSQGAGRHHRRRCSARSVGLRA